MRSLIVVDGRVVVLKRKCDAMQTITPKEIVDFIERCKRNTYTKNIIVVVLVDKTEVLLFLLLLIDSPINSNGSTECILNPSNGKTRV